MESDQRPMVARSSFKVMPIEFSNEWMVIRPGRARRSVFEGSKEQAISRARELLQNDGGGVIRVLDDLERVVEELRVSSDGDVTERRDCRGESETSDECSDAASDTMVILLYGCDPPDDAQHLFLVVDCTSKKILAAINGWENSAALERAGFEYQEPIESFSVTGNSLEVCYEDWGPISAAGIERKGRELCADIDGFATDPRFQSCEEDNRVLAAALWVLWDRHLASEEVQTRDGRVVRISRFLLFIDRQGYVTIEEYKGGYRAAKAFGRIAARQSPDDDSILDGAFDPSAPRVA